MINDITLGLIIIVIQVLMQYIMLMMAMIIPIYNEV